MRLEHDDPRLTAQALEELGPAEAAGVAAWREADAEGRAVVEAIRTASRCLSEALAAEPAPALSERQRRAACTPPAGGRDGNRGSKRTLAGVLRCRRPVAATAAVVVACLAVLAWRIDQTPSGGADGTETGRGHGPITRRTALDRPASIGDRLRAIGASDSGAGGATGPEAAIRAEEEPSVPRSGGAALSQKDPWYRQDGHTEGHAPIDEDPFRAVADEPRSTFSIDVDTASYANVRRWLEGGELPPPDAVRIEELINYFPYDYAAPEGDGAPFAIRADVAGAPWQPQHRLVRIGLKGREADARLRPPCNLVFLVDVSGSMRDANKLPLVQQALRLLVEGLRPDDRVALAVYAGASGLVLPSTSASDKATILAAIDVLEAGGSTNGGEGIELAYRVARENRIPGGANRVILCTDGDFNVGVTDRGSLVRLVQARTRDGVFLTVLGFGMGNYKDDMLESLADRGNGNYGYVDSLPEARKILVERASGTLLTIAKDVKIQVEFNPATVVALRLIGYENRLLAHQDFNDDTKDAGEIGAGHSVTALYQIVPVGVPLAVPGVDPLRYQQPPSLSRAAADGGLLTVKLRCKEADGSTSRLLEHEVAGRWGSIDEADPDFRFSAAVVAFGMVLRDSAHRGGASLELVRQLGRQGLGPDRNGYRTEFLDLVGTAADLWPPTESGRDGWPSRQGDGPAGKPMAPGPTVTVPWSWPPAPAPTPIAPGVGRP